MVGGTLIAIVTICITIQYLKELWYFYRRPNEYQKVASMKMRYGEDGDEELSTNARLMFGFPFFIVLGTFTSVGVLLQAFGVF